MVIDNEHADWVTGPLWANVSSRSPIRHFQIPSDEDAVPAHHRTFRVRTRIGMGRTTGHGHPQTASRMTP